MLVTPDLFEPTEPNGFIVFDGVNGGGKSTQLARLLLHVKEQGLTATSTREPGGTNLGSTVRQLVMQNSKPAIAPLAETFLFAADRAQHVAEIVKPAIARNEIIISDRYYYSTLAFQGYGRGLDLDMLRAVNESAIDNTRPDIVFLFDLDPAIGLERTRSRNSTEHDSFEQEELAFHTRLRNGFRELSTTLPEIFVVIDASQPEQAVWEQMHPYIITWLAALKNKGNAL